MSQDYPPNPAEKPGYRLEFEDRFTDLEISRDRWFPWYLPHWSSRAASGAGTRFHDGKLELVISPGQEPWCPEFNGNIRVSSLQTGIFAGKLNSRDGQHRFSPACRIREEQQEERIYTPQYGFFEIRARAVAQASSVCAFWMIGVEDTPIRSGEICIMEVKGSGIRQGSSVNGYGVRAFSDPHLRDEFFEDPFPVDAAQFHIYAAEWKPDSVDFYLDNRKVRTVSQSPDYPMQFMLNIYDIPTPEAVVPAGDFPKAFRIDYVRGYRREG